MAVDQPVCGHSGEIVEIDVAIIIQVAGEDVAAETLQGKRVVISSAYGDKIVSIGGGPLANPSSTIMVTAPGDNRAVGLDCKQVAGAIHSWVARFLTVAAPSGVDSALLSM